MNRKSTRELGREKEDLAADYLRDRLGFRIVERNYYCRVGELDIVALDGSTLVFVEVRYRRPGALVAALESVDNRKVAKIKAAVRHYLLTHRFFGAKDAEIRLDLCVVSDGILPVVLHKGVIEF